MQEIDLLGHALRAVADGQPDKGIAVLPSVFLPAEFVVTTLAPSVRESSLERPSDVVSRVRAYTSEGALT